MPYRFTRRTILALVAFTIACGGDAPTSHSGPPRIVSVSPREGANGVARTTSITVRFSEHVTAPPGSFAVYADGMFGGVVDGTTTVDGSRLTFTPFEPLAMGWGYTAMVTTAIEDGDGEHLERQHVWSFVSHVDSAPEQLARRVTVGVAVAGERLDAAGDIDDFYISGTAGAEWVVFIQSAPNPPEGIEILLADSLSGALVNSTVTPDAFPLLEDWSLGRVKLPRTGTYRIRVRGGAEASYTFRVDAINRAPESAPVNVSRDIAVEESIERVGDVDEFRFNAIAGEELSMSLQLLSGMTSGLMLELEKDDYVYQRLEANGWGSREVDLTTGRFTLPASGVYTIRLFGDARIPREQKIGTYRFDVHKVNPQPENGAVLQLDGPPIPGAIDRNGDLDEYSFTGTAGQLVILHLTAPPLQRERSQLVVHLLDESGTSWASATAGASWDDANDGYARRVALPHSGTWRARVQAVEGWVPTTGSYTLEAYTVSAAPEHVPATVAIGQIVTGERIDRPGDVDVFNFSGQANQILNVFLGTAAPSGLFGWVGLGMFTTAGTLALDGQSTGRFTVKDSTYTFGVDPDESVRATFHGEGAAYAFRVFAIDTTPESRPVAYVFGDTVASEVLYPAGDIDTYTFELLQPTTFDMFWEANNSGPWSSVRALVIPDGSDTAPWSNFPVNGTMVRRITLQPGRYRYIVLNENAGAWGDQFAPKVAMLTYRFAMTVVTP